MEVRHGLQGFNCQVVSSTLPEHAVVRVEGNEIVVAGDWIQDELLCLKLYEGERKNVQYHFFIVKPEPAIACISHSMHNGFGFNIPSGNAIHLGESFDSLFCLGVDDWGQLPAVREGWTPIQYENAFCQYLSERMKVTPRTSEQPDFNDPGKETVVRVREAYAILKFSDFGRLAAKGIAKLIRQDDPGSPFVGMREIKAARPYAQQVVDLLRDLYAASGQEPEFELLLTREELMREGGRR